MLQNHIWRKSGLHDRLVIVSELRFTHQHFDQDELFDQLIVTVDTRWPFQPLLELAGVHSFRLPLERSRWSCQEKL